MKRIVLAIMMLCALSWEVSAEYNGRSQNLINADNRLYHFGFILGLNTMDLNVQQSGMTADDGKIWFVDDTKYNLGFTVGMISDLRIFSWLNMRLTPALHFCERRVEFIDSEGVSRPDGGQSIQSNMLEVPLTFKIRGQRKNNYRPYLLVGGAMTVDMGRDSEAPLMLKQVDYGVEAGIGLDCYMPYFKFCPELKFYFGLGDVIERNRPEIADVSNMKFTHAIQRMASRLIILSFNFEN